MTESGSGTADDARTLRKRRAAERRARILSGQDHRLARLSGGGTQPQSTPLRPPAVAEAVEVEAAAPAPAPAAATEAVQQQQSPLDVAAWSAGVRRRSCAASASRLLLVLASLLFGLGPALWELRRSTTPTVSSTPSYLLVLLHPLLLLLLIHVVVNAIFSFVAFLVSYRVLKGGSEAELGGGSLLLYADAVELAFSFFGLGREFILNLCLTLLCAVLSTSLPVHPIFDSSLPLPRPPI